MSFGEYAKAGPKGSVLHCVGDSDITNFAGGLLTLPEATGTRLCFVW